MKILSESEEKNKEGLHNKELEILKNHGKLEIKSDFMEKDLLFSSNSQEKGDDEKKLAVRWKKVREKEYIMRLKELEYLKKNENCQEKERELERKTEEFNSLLKELTNNAQKKKKEIKLIQNNSRKKTKQFQGEEDREGIKENIIQIEMEDSKKSLNRTFFEKVIKSRLKGRNQSLKENFQCLTENDKQTGIEGFNNSDWVKEEDSFDNVQNFTSLFKEKLSKMNEEVYCLSKEKEDISLQLQSAAEKLSQNSQQ